MTDCSFCKDKNLADRTIYRDDKVWIFPTYIPIVPGHLLVCSNRCVPTLEDLNKDERESLLGYITKIKQVLQKKYNAEGFHVAINEGSIAGQSAPHVHVHIIPRKQGDEGVTEYDPRKFLYRPGSRRQTPQEELIEIAQELKSFFY